MPALPFLPATKAEKIIRDIFKQNIDSRPDLDATIAALPDCWQRGNFLGGHAGEVV
jgi:hypothetical protein